MAKKASKKSAKKAVRRAAKPKAAARAASAFRDPRLRIRMYRHGLGDCLLLRFAKDSVEGTFNVLIDCGLIGVASSPKCMMQSVVEDIAETCRDRIDIVVMTHEHWDHASGFSEQQVRAAFDKIDIREVWYAWTENPANELGRKLRKEREAMVKAVATAARALAGMTTNELAVRRSEDLASVLGFFGVDFAAAKSGSGSIGKTRAAFEYLAKRSGVRVRYCHPADPPFAIPEVDGVRVYIFGPPEDEVLLKKSRPTKSGREVYELSAEHSAVASLDIAFDRLASVSSTGSSSAGGTSDRPFDESYYAKPPSAELSELIGETWSAPDQDWRQIELDWTQSAETLALNLDSHTNNTCLVLAFEFADTGEVFLFPADAQVGNWLSWQDLRWNVRDDEGTALVTARDLLARTVFYKVGHHGSHNATLRGLGLELMTNENLTAFVPVDKTQALKSRWNEMPFEPLVARLREKTRGRLLRTDDVAAPQPKDLANLTANERERFKSALLEGDNKLYYELSFG